MKTPESSTVVRPAAVACLVLALIVCGPSAGPSARGQLPVGFEQSVDVQVPMPPQIVRTDGAPHLVYELHLTNMRREPVTVERVGLTAGPGRATLAEWSGAELQRRLGRPGFAKVAEPHVLPPGQRAVLFVWTLVAEPVPDAIAHQLTLRSGAAGAERPIEVRTAPTDVQPRTAADIGPPLTGGPWVAIYDPLLVGGHRTALFTLDGKARIPARFAVDWVRAPAAAGATGRYNTAPDYNGFGADVLAVADGRVTQVRDGAADLPTGVSRPDAPVPLDRASGNFVVLALPGGRFAIYEHLKQGSVTVRQGQQVKRGQPIAQLGSSGSTSIGPHLHFHIADADATLTAEGVPFAIDSFAVLGRYASLEGFNAGEAWTASSEKGEGRRAEHPPAMGVVRFPEGRGARK